MMKCIRLLITMLLLCMLPLACLAAPAIEHDYQPIDSERIVYTLPEGLSAKVTKSDGRLSVLVDSAKTDWNQAITSLNNSNEIPMRVSSLAPDGSYTKMLQINLRNSLDPDEGTLTEQAFIEFDTVIRLELDHREPNDVSNSSWGNSRGLASFDIESSSILPSPTPDNQYIAYLIIWYPDQGDPVYEYYFIDISYTSDTVRSVEVSNAPKSRIHPHMDMDGKMKTTVDVGSVTYEIPLGHQLCGRGIFTQIEAPAGAKSWKLGGEDSVKPVFPFEVNGKSFMGMSLSEFVWDYDSAEVFPYAVFWYADEEGKDLLRFERLAIDLIIGNPDPFPRYIDELTAVPQDRVRSLIWTGEKAIPSMGFLKTVYSANQKDRDIFRLSVIPEEIPSGTDLDSLFVDVFVEPPKGAVAYTKEQRSRDTIHGNMDRYYTDQYKPKLVDPSRREWNENEFSAIDGKDYLWVGSMAVSESKPFEHDSKLRLYTEGENSQAYAGGVTMLYWYDSFDPDAQPIKKEYIIKKMDPFTLTSREEAITDESQLPAPDEMTVPVIIISKGEEITDLYLVIEKSPTSDPNHIYYDLHVEDADGNEYKLGGDAIVIIPYPYRDEMGPNTPHSFKLAHYHNGKKLEYTEENGLLWRTEHGLAFKTSDFSPFVLSWEELPEGSAANLPKTGDSSAPLFLLVLLLAFSSLGLARLRRSRA